MKNTDYIIGLDEKALTALADEETVPVPQELSARVNEALVAAALKQEETAGHQSILAAHPYAVSVVMSFVCAVAIFAVVHLKGNSQPMDTFDDPHLAYAAFEEAFGRVSSKMDECEKIVSMADYTMQHTSETINRLKLSE